MRCDPAGKPPAAQDAVGARPKVAEGAGKSGTCAFCLWLEVTFGLECFFFFFLSFFRPLPPFVEDTDVFMFADHLLRAPSVQLLKLSLHVTRLSRCEASSNPWRV